jgi:hypothetical protein
MTESIDTTGPAGTLVFHNVRCAGPIRTLVTARADVGGIGGGQSRGRKGGSPPLLNTNRQRTALLMLKNREMSVAAIAEHLGVSRSML